MSYYKFGIDDIFYNTIETYPQYTVQVYDTNIYINGETNRKGAPREYSKGRVTFDNFAQVAVNDIIRLVATDTTVVTITATQGSDSTTDTDTNSPKFQLNPANFQKTMTNLKKCINANSKFEATWPIIGSAEEKLEINQKTPGSAGDTAIVLTLANAGSITKNDFTGGGGKPDIKSVSQGEISLYELNIDRPATRRIYPFINKQGARAAFKTVSDTSFDNTDIFDHGDQINGIYPLSASITRIYVDEGADVSSYTFLNINDANLFIAASKNKKYIRSLKSTLKNYINLSKHYAYDADQIVGTKGATSTIALLEALNTNLDNKTIIFEDAEGNTHTITFDKDVNQADSTKTIAGVKDINTTAGALTSLKKSLDLAITAAETEINMSTSVLIGSTMVITMTSNKEAGDGKTITGTAISNNYMSATTFSGASFKEGENKGTQIINMICIPSIFYGSSIKRGSVNLKFNVTGSTIAELSDKNKNGELIQASGSAYAATAVDAIDTTGVKSANVDSAFSFTIPTSAGGEGGATTIRLSAAQTTNPPVAGAGSSIGIGFSDKTDAEIAALIINAINAVATTNIVFAVSNNGMAGYDSGITAAEGSSDTQITLTMNIAGTGGNLTNALAYTSLGTDIVDVAAFTGAAGGTTNKNDSVAGVVLYNEGIIMLTGSWAIAPHTEAYILDQPTLNPKWIYFGSGMKSVGTDHTAIAAGGLNNSSFEFSFEGVNPIPTITMMAHARAGELNYSNNPTFLQHGTSTTSSYGRMAYMEVPAKIKNTVKSKFTNHTASFKKQTYISKIGIYDKNRNLIAIANIANPLKKEEEKEYTFKMKLDF